MRPRRLLPLVAALLLATGCSASLDIGAPPGRLPSCPVGDDWPEKENVPPIVLMAQAVPTASWLPCITALPAGITFDDVDTRNGLGRFWLSSGREGKHAIRVALTRECQPEGDAAEPNPQPGITRYVELGGSGPREWYHVFRGGCISYRFDLPTDTSEAAIAAGLGFVSRAAVGRWVSDQSDGRLRLDPPRNQDGPP